MFHSGYPLQAAYVSTLATVMTVLLSLSLSLSLSLFPSLFLFSSGAGLTRYKNLCRSVALFAEVPATLERIGVQLSFFSIGPLVAERFK